RAPTRCRRPTLQTRSPHPTRRLRDPRDPRSRRRNRDDLGAPARPETLRPTPQPPTRPQPVGVAARVCTGRRTDTTTAPRCLAHPPLCSTLDGLADPGPWAGARSVRNGPVVPAGPEGGGR